MTNKIPTYEIAPPDGWTFTIDSTAGFNGYSTVASPSITKEPTDIYVAGKSLKEFMDSVEERLAILEPNEKLEAEWAELKELGEQYRAKEREIKEKARVWKILKD